MTSLVLNRLRVAVRRRQLDAALASGADPAADPALALRARQLRAPRTRSALANTLVNLLGAAEEPPGAWHKGDPRPPLQREAVLAARPELLALIDRLMQPGEMSPRSLARTSQLAWDSASPVYAGNSSEGVAEFARTIRG